MVGTEETGLADCRGGPRAAHHRIKNGMFLWRSIFTPKLDDVVTYILLLLVIHCQGKAVDGHTGVSCHTGGHHRAS